VKRLRRRKWLLTRRPFATSSSASTAKRAKNPLVQSVRVHPRQRVRANAVNNPVVRATVAVIALPKRRKGMILFEDETSFAQWGSLSYTWSRRGRQPEVPTSGKRKGYKVYGAIDYFSGRLFYQGIEGRFHSESY